MGDKVEISEVIAFSDELRTASEDIKSSLKSVEESIESISAMSSFSGKAANEAKAYFEDLHQTLLTTLNGLFTDLDTQLKKHLQLFQARVDSSESAIIESNYLNNTEQDIRDDYGRLEEEQETVRQIIASVSDITSASHPISFTLDSDKEDAVKTVTELEEELTSFTSEGSQQIAQTEDLLHQIEVTLNNAGAVKGDARFTDYKGTSTMVGLAALKDYNAEKREAKLEKAKAAMDSAVKDLNGRSAEVLNQAYIDLKNGEINSEKFNAILSAVKKTNGDISENELKDDETELLINYLENQEMLDQYLVSNQNFAGYVLNNLGKVGWLATPEAISIFTKSLGTTMEDVAKYLDDGSKVLKEGSESLLKKAGTVLVAGKAANPTFAAIGFQFGVESDMANGKTRGEAYAHNGGALLAGVGTTVVVGLFVSNPVGLAAVGVAAAGVGATMLFEFLYNKNVLGLQDGLDWAGNKLDDAKDWVGDKLDSAGEALSSGLDFINPFS